MEERDDGSKKPKDDFVKIIDLTFGKNTDIHRMKCPIWMCSVFRLNSFLCLQN